MANPYTLSELETLTQEGKLPDQARLKATPQTVLVAYEKATSGSSASAGGFAGATGATGTVPQVPTTLAGDTVSFAMPNQLADIEIPKTIQTQTGANGATEMTYADAVQWLHDIQGTAELARIQEMLHNSGYLAGTKIPYGTLNTATVTAWKQALDDATTASQALVGIGGQPITVMGLLATGQGSQFISTVQALQTKYQAATNAAASVEAPMLTLTDPNQAAQAFAAAREAIGAGAPSQAETDAFVKAFHSAQVSAVQDAYTTQKQDYLGGAQQDLSRLDTLISGAPTAPTGTPDQGPPVPGAGPMPSAPPTPEQEAAYQAQLDQYKAALNGTGPVDVATKAMPNLDAEAMAAAKAADPSQYYASQVSYYGEMIHNLLAGNLVGQTAPVAPSQTAPGGAILSTPMAGAL